MKTTVTEAKPQTAPTTDDLKRVSADLNAKANNELHRQFSQFVRRKEIAEQLRAAAIKVVEGKEMVAFNMVADCMTKLS